MKVAFYTISLFRQVTGIERVALRVAQSLKAARHEIIWITPPGSGAPIEALPPGTTVVLAPYGFSIDHIKNIRTAICDTTPDVMVVMIANGMVSLFPSALAGLNVPLLISEHNDPQHYVSRWWGIGSDEKNQHRMRMDVMRCADRVHLLSDRFTDSVPGSVRERVQVIPNSAPMTTLRADTQIPTDDRLLFVSIGRLSEQKGLQLGLEAFALFAPDHPNWHYHIFGTGEKQDYLQQQIEKLKLTDRVFLKGHTDTPLTELANSQILLMPSLFEAWPLVAGEAQAVGLPVLGFNDCAALDEMFGNNNSGGRLAMDRSPEALASLMSELAEDQSLLLAIANEGLQATKNYTVEVIDRRWVELIEETAAAVPSLLRDCVSDNPNHSSLSSSNPESVQSSLNRLNSDLSEAQVSNPSSSLLEKCTSVVRTIATKPFKEVTEVAKKRLSMRFRSYTLLAGRIAAHAITKRGITMLTLPGIEDGPRHLAPLLQKPPSIIKIPPRLLFNSSELLKMARSRVIVTEGGLPHRFQTGQKVIQIWHSSGFIKRAANLARKLSRKEFHRTNGRYDYVICPSVEMAQLYAEAFCVDLSRVLPLGSVKTDYLLQQKIRDEYTRNLYEKAPALAGKKLYVYAPTFRGEWPNCTFHYPGLSLDTLNEALNEDERLLIHLHPNFTARPLAEQRRRTGLIPGKDHNKIILSSHLPMEWLQSATHCLISDYSGALLDAVAGRTPVVCFAHDVESYVSQITPDFLDEVPNLVTDNSTTSFIDAVHNANTSSKRYRSFRKRWVGASDGESGQRAAKLIEEL